MQCFSELVPPTAVTHAITLPFLGPSATNLVVAKTSLLQIFACANHPGRQQQDKHEARKEEALRLVGEYPLSGTVTSLARIRAADTKTGGEALLVSLKDAKVSLLEWDPENHRISTVSIHYYENGKVQLAPFEPPLSDSNSKLVVDPRSRCAALRFASRHLAIIPFRQPDDDIAAVEDDFLEDVGTKTKGLEHSGVAAAASDRKSTPYGASFVLPLTALDPSLSHPVDIAFLYEYREPTFGIVSANRNAATALLDERKDPLTYTVITLDLEQRASTPLLSVKGLPFDIWKIKPLPQPIGGSLLVGANELVHIDQSGKTNAVGVNEFARQCSDFSIADQSYLNLRLEESCIESLNPDTGDLLIVSRSGALAILTFKIDGRTVSGLHVHIVDEAHGGKIPSPSPSAIASIATHKIFVGSQVGDAKVLSWSAQASQVSRKRSHAQMLGEDMGFEIDEADLEDADEDDAEDDLYGDENLSKSTMQRVSKTVAPENYDFSDVATISNLAPVRSVAIGKVPTQRKQSDGHNAPLELLASIGEGRSSRLAKLTGDLVLDIVKENEQSAVQAVFPFSVKSDELTEKHYIVTSELTIDGKEISKLMNTDHEAPENNDRVLPWAELAGTDFEEEGRTSNVFYLGSSNRTIQVRESDVRSYDADFGLSQIFPVVDSETEDELQVIHSSFCDPYLLIVRNDSSVQLLKADATGELDEVEGGELQKEAKWLSACLYQSKNGPEGPLCFLLSERGSLVITELKNFGRATWSAPNLAALPAVLTTEDRQRRAAARETLAEIIFADMGPTSSPSPYLILRSSTDEIVMYEPFHSQSSRSRTATSYCDGLNFRKVPGIHIPKFNDDTDFLGPAFLKALPNVNGKAMVFVPGGSPSIIIKESSIQPQIFDLRSKPISYLTQLSGELTSTSLVYIDSSKTLRQSRIRPSTSFAFPRCVVEPIHALPSDHAVHEISYHAKNGLYVVISSEPTEFIPPDEETQQYELESGLSLQPESKQFYIHLLSPINNTIISTYQIPPYEHVTGVDCAPLETSETTRITAPLITVGTITHRADPYADKGAIYVFSVVDVVPEPDHPETGFKLHLLSREETRGAITAITAIAGLSGTAQGQKLMFRGLREDGQNLPVAFLDTQIYTTSLKTLGASKMWLAADYWKGLWFGGYTQEPPRINIFAKSAPRMALVDAEFLPHDGGLCLLGVDDRGGLQVWQFDPEQPKSLGGTRLIHKSSFHLGHLVTGMKMLPSSVAAMDQSGADGEADTAPLYQVVTLATSGQIGLVTPLDEAQYRRLSALQGQLTNVLEHPAGLNPRAYRNVKSEDGGGRGVVDGDLIRRIGELGAGRRSEIIGRVVGEGGWWEIRSDLEVLSGKGLNYF
ncbi:hypothetical protein K461DRAFT_253002 [Myriangium duriaei CBS 260.36]|uniref:Cleavage/polyadenylation specificity factor A subunit C-terminal domain-containing protein n=1 Tax=Myriangium duriaei CBS 260.36 TaxID=1168546 RepID=A0A9P4J805_9PEZI|nr:hypothetical protein K461DRAFT_253002 [Myriangium duriaei CBS 260.36]